MSNESIAGQSVVDYIFALPAPSQHFSFIGFTTSISEYSSVYRIQNFRLYLLSRISLGVSILHLLSTTFTMSQSGVYISGEFSEPMTAQHNFVNNFDLEHPDEAMSVYARYVHSSYSSSTSLLTAKQYNA